MVLQAITNFRLLCNAAQAVKLSRSIHPVGLSLGTTRQKSYGNDGRGLKDYSNCVNGDVFSRFNKRLNCLSSGQTVVDLGCGKGGAAEDMLAYVNPGVTVLGVDQKKALIPGYKSENGTKLTYIVDDLHTLESIESDSIALAISIEVAPYLDISKFIPQVYRCLAEDGIAFIHLHDAFVQPSSLIPDADPNDPTQSVYWFNDIKAKKHFVQEPEIQRVMGGTLPKILIVVQKTKKTTPPEFEACQSVPTSPEIAPRTLSHYFTIDGQPTVKLQEYPKGATRIVVSSKSD